MGVDYSFFQILLQIVKISIMVSPHAGTRCAGILSTPADFPFSSAATAISTSSRRIVFLPLGMLSCYCFCPGNDQSPGTKYLSTPH